MSILLEKLRKKTQTILMSTKDNSLLEQIHAIKKNLYVDTTLATLLHSNHFDHKWNPRVNNKIQEHVDSLYKNKRHKNIKKTIFEYLDGWVGKEDVDGLLMFVFSSRVGDISYDPKDNKDFDIITNYIQDKIIDVFPLSSGQALALAIEYTNPTTFPDWDKGWDTLGLKPLNEHKKRELNPKVRPGETIRVISTDKTMNPTDDETGDSEYRPPENYSIGWVKMVQQDETPDGEEITILSVYFPDLEAREDYLEGYDDGIRILMDPYDKYIKSDDVLTEAGMIGGGRKPRRNIPDSVRGNLVQAIFTRKGGWGRPSQKFIIFMTPTGSIADIQQSSSTSSSNIPFEIDQKISFGDLYRFEQDSEYDLQMKGRLHEHNDEQLNMFPTGQWDWPKELGDDEFDEEDIEDVKKAVSERQVKFLFNKWDEDGVSFEDLKLLGIPANSSVINALLMKRYILSGTRPLPVSFSFDCDDLAGMFLKSREYDMDYIEDFLCGKDSFWDHEDWYNYEWDDYMADQVDEKNWKTISNIFGGVTQSVAEDMLNRTSSSEEVDGLTEKYDDEIDEIRSFIVWTHNDENEWAVKDAMKEDILDKLGGHFDDGQLFKSEEDNSYSWYFEDDLRNWLDLNDWDDPTKFEFHPDYAGETLENILMQTSPEYITPKVLFEALIKEKYTFEDYDYGAQGDMLEAETKWFDGYYQPDYDINKALEDRLDEMTYDPVVTTPEGETEPLNEQEKKVRIKTIYEDDNWKYVWPINDYSFCQLGVDTDWCKSGYKTYEGDGTSYILQDKNTNEKFWFTDRERVPGLPSGDVTIKDSNSNWQDVHRFLANKQTLHDMFRQEYSTFDLMKYGIELDPNLLEDYSKTNKFAEAVYRMTDYPNDEKEEELSEFLGDKFELDNDQRYGAFANTISFNDDGVSLYIPDDIFKEKYMGVDEDDGWYFDIGANRYWGSPDCEEMDSEELQFVGYHINADNKGKLDNLITLFGKNPDDYSWKDEGILDEMMWELFPNIWENNYWELLDAIGCSVGRARVKAMEEEVQNEKVLEYNFEGGNDALWKLDITYTQLLYIIGDKKINNFSEIEDTEINHIDGGLHDTYYDAWDMDEEGLTDFNYALNSIIDNSTEYVGDDVETILNNREKYEQIIKDLGFAKKYENSNFEIEIELGPGTGKDGKEYTDGQKRVTIVSYDPKSDEVEFQVSGPNYWNKRHKTPLDKLSDYAVSEELFESIVE